MKFVPGQAVVCVSNSSSRGMADYFKIGRKYTVSMYHAHRFPPGTPFYSILDSYNYFETTDIAFWVHENDFIPLLTVKDNELHDTEGKVIAIRRMNEIEVLDVAYIDESA